LELQGRHNNCRYGLLTPARGNLNDGDVMNRDTKNRAIIEELWKKDPRFSRKKASESTGVNQRTIYKWVKDLEKGTVAPIRRIRKPDKGGTIDDFRRQYDDSVVVPNQIKAGIKKLVKNGEPTYKTDQEFREICGVAPGKWRRYAEDFRHLQIKKDGLHWWGHPDIIEEMRKAVNR